MRARTWILNCLAIAVATVFAAGCGDKNDGNGNGDGGNGDGALPGDGGNGDGGCSGIGCDPTVDAPQTGGNCQAGNPQCSNCIDDDGDGFIDGDDIECSGSNDNDEGSFATGIPGDNKDAVNQDCFFDGNSGAGDDGCNIHVCCLLGAATKADCPIGANQYDPNQCPPPIGTGTLTQQCIDVCSPLTPPGCDCFSCCTVCDQDHDSPTFGQCFDIATNPAVSPNCNDTNLADTTACKRCEKSTACGSPECSQSDPPPPAGDPAHCVLCPGQDPSTLPADCNTATCPTGTQTCDDATPCGTGAYCSNGCCIGIIQ